MPDAEFFARWGLFVRRAFLDPEACRRIAGDVRTAHRAPARVYRQAAPAAEIDRRLRKTAVAEVPSGTDAAVARALGGVRPALERHFGLTFTGQQPIDFLVYGPGDFFEAHADGGSASAPGSEAVVVARRVSAVLFLNDRSDDVPAPAGTFSGGDLTFRLLDDPRAQACGFPLRAEAGLLIAFPSELVHEVTPVTSGERLTAVTFFE
jgi:predicted 2-oxoglutarate/Fe(II)-dependent dioxygenase YbiX